jgi:hypothetical protein
MSTWLDEWFWMSLTTVASGIRIEAAVGSQSNQAACWVWRLGRLRQTVNQELKVADNLVGPFYP